LVAIGGGPYTAPAVHDGETGRKQGIRTVSPMDVVLLRWPAEDAGRERLRAEAVPRLLLVEHGTPPPVVGDELEDWIRVPADEVDLHARVAALEQRAHARTPGVPDLDDDGVLRYAGSWVPLPPVEARLTQALIDRCGAVVSREALGTAGWPDGPPGRNALDVHVLRLRRRLAPLGLVIRTVRSRGYLLERTA
jgi:DNA-binding response OmpR family regulator